MRAIIQRVTQASVSVDAVLHSHIKRGLLVLVAVEDADTSSDADWLAAKICNLRIFNDGAGIPNLSVLQTKGDVLAVSQFTLFASTKKGNRPGYSRASGKQLAEPMYNYFVAQLAALIQKPVATGVFGADMQVELVNDGPITIMIDTLLKE